ncbi:MAG: type II toxin-antitoxin system VapC family toxin [Acidobacteriaceae bacterium]|jgi:predicted nucleic acid-binding protein|nr:type II toxin-antitoxin system VapC family toxin [Acidobacteriaceae bacterium]
MILLDTNVISEPLKPRGAAAVLAWIDGQDIDTLYLSTITLAELRFGIAIMPYGRRKNDLRQQLEQHIVPLFAGRILSFTPECAEAYAVVRAGTQATGQSIDTADAYIAAVAVANDFVIATRDTRPFLAAGLTVINPWNMEGAGR